jgi:short-subunit dehydrogenase
MKTILITGGSDGLGKAIAARLATNNKVIILSPHEDKLRVVAQELGCEYKVCDVRDYAQTEKVAQEIGLINTTKAVIPAMKQQGSGLIINVNSQGGLYAKAERGVYTATKWAITGFTKAMQPELAPYGIAMTGLYPGMMKTDMFNKMGIEKDTSNGLELDEVAKTIEFLLSFEKPTMFPEIGIKHIDN